ncbi:MAG: hypothetical protein NTZ27_12215 [Ignavibacteriales bacterium]|nr:hypothetical protein [Ignavibacteriales bacterium]
MKHIIKILSLILIISTVGYSWDYNEHKELGDAAFLKILKRLIESGYFNNQPETSIFLENYLQMKYDTQSKNYYFLNLSHEDNIITYGTLNGLAGDHSDNPLDMNEFLQYRSSVLNRIVKLQSEYSSKYETGAANMDVLSKDFKYLLLALTDLSHFHNYGTPLQKQIGEFNKKLILKLQRPFSVDTVMSELKSTNSINKYVSLHTFAIYLAEKAGANLSKNPEKSKEFMYYALIFNSFADHFLEDIFPSGHMVVNRSLLSGVINNRALHDFYNEEGVNVANLRGETWKQYGDGTLNSRFSSWKTKASYSDVTYSQYSEDTERIINAVSESIADIFSSLKSASADSNHKSIFDRVPDDETRVSDFFLSEYKSLTYIPIPFNTDVSGFKLPENNINEIRKNTQLLQNWSFIRSRVANSISLGLSTVSGDEGWHEYDLRLSFGSAFYSYNYNFDRTKAWTVDYWFGTTISFALLKQNNFDYWAHILKGGIAYNYDIWVSESRFLGIYGYIEAGWLRVHSFPYIGINDMGQYVRGEIPGENHFLFSPSIGLQLGSLIGINYYEWPVWLRVPIQWLLPLKFRYSAKILAGSAPEYQWIFELDLVF